MLSKKSEKSGFGSKNVRTLVISVLKSMVDFSQPNISVDWSLPYYYPTVSGMRMKVFNADNNGFNDYRVVHREGKRVFIDEQAYLRWRNRNFENK